MITVVKSQSGQIIRDNKTNPSSENKHVVIESSSIDITARYMNKKRAIMIIPGNAEALAMFLSELKQYPKARIVTHEFLESEIPEEFEKDFNPKLQGEEQLTQFIKVAGDSGIECTQNGERIFAFKRLDFTGVEITPKVRHDNVEDIKLANAIARAKAEADAKTVVVETPEVVAEVVEAELPQ